MDPDKFKMLDLAARLAESEFDRSWRFYGIALTVNGGLIVVMSLAFETLPGWASLAGSVLVPFPKRSFDIC